VVNRAYSLLHVKEVDVERRVFSGLASTPTPDRMGDVVEPKGARFSNPLSLLLYHDSHQPVGEVSFGKPTDKGIPFTASIPNVPEPGRLQDRVNEAWHSVKYRVIKGVSIGFRALEDGVELMKSGGYRFTDYEVVELSLVPIPAQAEATIQTIKSFDAPYLALQGTGSAVSASTPPAVAGTAVVSVRKGTRSMAKTYQEQIKDFEAARAAKTARREEIQAKASSEDRGKDASEKEEFDTLTEQIKSIDGELVDLHELQRSMEIKPVAAPAPVAAQVSPNSNPVVQLVQNVPAGIGIARSVMAQIQARKEYRPVADVVRERWPSDSRLMSFVSKAAVPAGNTTNAVWMAPLADQTNLANEFVEYLRPRTIVGRIPGLTQVPFNIRYTGQSTGAVANWVGQGKGKPVTSFSTFADTLLRTKIAAIAVITEELALDSSPSAEALVRNELARAVIERMDIDFIDPAQAASAGVNPASITNGLTALTPSGTSESNARTDLTNLLSTFVENNVDPTNLVLVMPNSIALALSLMVNSLGQPSFPGITPAGGTLLGIPVVASQYAANASGAGNLVIAINAPDIFLADDGQVRMDASREASIEMLDAPTMDANVPTAASVVSMYQTNCIAVRAERYINWKKVRSSAVVYIDDVNWGSVGSPS
jgi:HK97 family phage major capsid protein